MLCGWVSLTFLRDTADKCLRNSYMKILFLSRWFPYPTNNGSKLRIYNLLRGLSKHHDVTLLSFSDQPKADHDTPEVRELCSNVYVIPWREFDPNSVRARFGFLSIVPRSIVDTFSSKMADQITQLLQAHHYDLIIASQLSMAAYRPYFASIPALFEEVEIGLSHGEMRSLDIGKRLRHVFTWFKLRIYLSRLLASYPACTVVSEQERELLTQTFSLKHCSIEIIPNGVQVGEYENIDSSFVPNQLTFSGSFRYQANYDAMVWFVSEVFPRIRAQVPEAHLMITGDHADLPLPSLKNITLAGYVDDIKQLVASSNVSVAPLLSGGGTRLKILEAMTLGAPVVSTSKGAEGLGAISGEHLLIADMPDIFADHVVKILRDGQLHKRIASNALRFIKEKYNWEIILPRFLQLAERVAGRK